MSNKSNDGGPAFPIHCINLVEGKAISDVFTAGMSLRDWFAGMAMCEAMRQVHDCVQQIPELTEAAISDEGVAVLLGRVSGMAYTLADAMLAARDKEAGPGKTGKTTGE